MGFDPKWCATCHGPTSRAEPQCLAPLHHSDSSTPSLTPLCCNRSSAHSSSCIPTTEPWSDGPGGSPDWAMSPCSLRIIHFGSGLRTRVPRVARDQVG